MNHTGSPNGNIGLINKFEYDRDKTDLIPTTLWNSTTGKLRHHKQATVNTPDGKRGHSYKSSRFSENRLRKVPQF